VFVTLLTPEALCEHVVAGTQFDNMRRGWVFGLG
jgi:hypothetical protein